MNRARMWRRGREQLAAWLPALMMGLFALGTWWLVRSAPGLTSAPPSRALEGDPDYRMQDFSVRNFDAEGRMLSELLGKLGRHYPDSDTLEVDAPRMRLFDEHGRLSTGRAARGLASNDGMDIHLYGDAQLVRSATEASADQPARPRLAFRGPYLHIERQAERLSSDQPVELLRGPDRFTGQGLDYDHESGVALLHGRVHGTLAAPGGAPAD